MAWDCRHKMPDGGCYRLGKPCTPGERGCVLYGKFIFPFKDADTEELPADEPNAAEAESDE